MVAIHVFIEGHPNQLPDMDFPINGKAEGRILVPWEHNEFPEMAVQDTSGAYFLGITATV